MKILLFSSLYATREISGAEKIVKILAEGLVERGHRALVVCLSQDSEERAFELNGVGVRQVRQRNIYSPWPGKERGAASRAVWHALDVFNPTMLAKLGALLDRERPDVVHSHLLVGFTLAPWLAARRRRLPLVHTMHDWYLLCPSSAMFRANRLCETQCGQCALYRWPHRRYSSFVDAPVGPSQFYLDGHLRAGFFRSSPLPRVVHNCFEGPLDPPIDRAPAEGLRVGFFGRLSPAKGIEELLKAFLALPQANCRLVVGGGGDAHFEERLRATYADRRIAFLGKTTPAEMFREIDVLVVPSLWHEAFPLVMLEAFGYGVPVIASRRGGNAELVEEGRNGYLFEPTRPTELSRLLERLIADPKPLMTMRQACLATAERHYKDHMIERYLSVYEEAAAARKLIL